MEALLLKKYATFCRPDKWVMLNAIGKGGRMVKNIEIFMKLMSVPELYKKVDVT